MNIEELNLSVRAYNCLKRAGIDTAEQLRQMDDEQLARVRNMSARCVQEIREKVEYRQAMTNADRLDAMSIEDKAQFLYSIAYARETPWSKPFAEKFCDQCQAPEYTLEDGRKLCLHECDFADGKCPHGGEIVWWLQQPADET